MRPKVLWLWTVLFMGKMGSICQFSRVLYLLASGDTAFNSYFYYYRPQRGGMYMRENGIICPFGVFPCFMELFASKLAIFP